MDNIFQELESALYKGLDDIDYDKRSAILDVLSLLLPSEKFKPLVDEFMDYIKSNYNSGNEEQKQHALYLIDFLLGTKYSQLTDENSNPHTNNIPIT